ncbi:cilia- and flagella-associated protein 69-like isoform X2 [Betta splendens]|uniref:Cilia- and flagella-associated protein 69-like isoform X2 n=1 Tax=Betta splendens TaxID=158456 RepID=A0A6P7NWA2_BETSP|nr:cilia- and flagella-associated protein 69-like isoform X2 [Betta splendens]
MDSSKTVSRRKADVPAIRSRASDKNQFFQEVSAQLDLRRVLGLLEDPLTTNLKERHLFVLRKTLKRSQNGFLLKELADVARILNICAAKVKDHPEYGLILCEALQICRLPFLKEKTSDELNYAQDVIEFLSHMGCLMRVSDAEVRHEIVECVKSFYSCVAPTQLLDGLRPTSPGYRLQLLEHSDLAQTLFLSMSALENQPAIKLQLLQTLQILSRSSDLNCALILEARGAEAICLHMNEPDPSGCILSRSSEILWNLLERGSREQVTRQLCSMECVVSLKEAFFQQLMNCSLPRDLQLRNDLLVVTTLIAESPNSLLIDSLFAKQLMAFVTFPELRKPKSVASSFKLSYNSEDLEMKKLLLNLLVLMSKDVAAVQLYKEEQVMLALLTLIKPPPAPLQRRPGSRHWSRFQQEELQLQALAAFSSIAPLMLDEYMCCQGNACLLLLLDWCTGKDASSGEGHSFHGTGGSGSTKAQMRYCVRTLRSVTSAGEESVNQDLCDQGIISQLLGILMQMEEGSDEDDVVTLEMKSDIQLILSALCETEMHRKELFGSEGVEMAIHFLRKGSDKFYSGLGHNKLILSTVDCVWSCIVGCYTTEDYFLAKQGVFLLLDLLSSSPRCVHGVVLATLLELCDNPSALSHILSWTDEGGRSAPRLLLQLWKEEEEELGVRRDTHGVIADPQKPILSSYQEEDSQLLFADNMLSAAVLEISENLRSKIYSIFARLGFQDLPGLSKPDHVTLSIVRRYLDFKVCEVWEEISREVRLDGMRPISPDEEALSTICRISEDAAKKVIAEQKRLLEQQEKEDASEEEHMYKEMKSHWNQQELEAKSWDRYISKSLNYETLKKHTESSRSKSELADAALHTEERFTEQVTSDTQEPVGVKLTVARASLKTGAQDQVQATAQDPEYFSTASVKGS